MTISEAILTLNANVIVACERARFDSATVKMVEDALDTIEDALKAMEPRVMTLEEVLGGGECWVEYINGGRGYCDCYLDDDAKSIVINRTLSRDFNVPPNGYGKSWRCWSVRPTDEQREGTPWET